MSPGVLVLHDADRIQDYIFATGRLREIRGASALIDSLTTRRGSERGRDTLLDELLQEQFPDAEVVFAGGGNFVAQLPDGERGKQFEQEFARRFYQETEGATSTGLCYEKALPDGGAFGEVFRAAQRELQDRKNRGETGAASGPFWAASGLMRPCQSCARFPAVPPAGTNPNGAEERLCANCTRKQKFAGKDLPRIYNRFFTLPEERSRRFSLMPDQFSEIGDLSHPAHYIGVIYCDGNRVRTAMDRLRSREQFKEFSTKLDDATRDSVVEVLRRHFPEPVQATRAGSRRKKSDFYPFQIILCGGDDLVLVVPADKALPVAADFIRTFERKARGIDITTSAGVVLAKDSHPFRDLVRLAKELLKSAKGRTRKEGGVGCLDAMVLQASGAMDLKSEREQAYRGRDTHKVDLMPRPLTIPEFDVYKDAITRLSQERFPTTNIYAMYRSLWRGYVPAVLRYYDTYGRSPARKRELYDYLQETFALTDGPWQAAEPADDPTKLPPPRRSPLVLLGEWYEFLSENADADAAEEEAL